MRYSHVSEVPLALAVFLATDGYDYNDDPLTVSATTLIKPLRQVILASRVPESLASTPLPDMMKSRMGAAIHDGIERAWLNNYAKAMKILGYPQRVVDQVVVNPTPEQLKANPDLIPVYLEQRLKKQVGKWTVTGKFDFVGEGRVQDFKSTSVWTYQNQVNDKKYPLQGAIYRWLDPELITQDEMDIHYIFTDWSASKAKADPQYPNRAFKKQSFKLLSLAGTERYVRERLHLLEKFWDADEADIPLCSDEDLWRSKPVFKYFRNKDKTTGRSTKNFETRQDAVIRLIEDGNTGVVLEKPGEVTACKYCQAFPVCSQKDQLIASGDLLLGT